MLLLSFVALALIFLPKIIPISETETDPTDIKKLDSLSELLENKEYYGLTTQLFEFNPNTISKDSLLLIGFPEYLAERLIKYRSKGGRFYTKADVKKIYGMPDPLMERIYGFISLPDSISESLPKVSEQKINLNTATTEQLKQIPMIGNTLSLRIVKYRNILGGFISLDQLDEVYGLSDTGLKNTKLYTFIDSGFRPKLVKVNSDSLEVLQSHPYISWQLAEDMVRYREVNSTIKSQKVLADFKSIDKSNFQKLIFYLDFQ